MCMGPEKVVNLEIVRVNRSKGDNQIFGGVKAVKVIGLKVLCY